jgi:hypothetical protein
MNAALVEDAQATRGECTYDRGVFAAREAALCTQIVELGAGGIKRIGSHQDIVNQIV